MGFLEIENPDIFYTGEDFNLSAQSNKELQLPDDNWCLPACVTTLIYYWKEVTNDNFPIPFKKDMNFWIDIWSKIIQKGRRHAAFAPTSYDKIPTILKELKLNDLLVFKKEESTCDLLNHVKRFVTHFIPIPVIVEVLAAKFYNQPSLLGSRHAILILGFQKPNFFQVYDPARPELRQYWTPRNEELMENCMAAPYHMAFIIPKKLNQIPVIPYKQARVDEW